MKAKKHIPIKKIVIHLIIFISFTILCTCGIYLYSFPSNNYEPMIVDKYSKTYNFTNQYLKYIERLAEYTIYKEKGFLSKKPLVTPSDISQVKDIGPIINESSVKDLNLNSSFKNLSEQAKFEYYNQKLNNPNSNFCYYVSNLSTKTSYYSEKLETLATKENLSIEQYLSHLNEYQDTYMVLNTSNSRYTTSEDISDTVESSNSVKWAVEQLTSTSNGDYIIYTFTLNELPYADEFYNESVKFYNSRTLINNSKFLLVSSLIVLILFLYIAIRTTGYKTKNSELSLFKIDKFSLEPFIIFMSLLLIASVFGTDFYLHLLLNSANDELYNLFNLLSAYPVVMITSFSIIRRIKSNTLFSNTYFYKFISIFTKCFSYLRNSKSLGINVFIFILTFITMQFITFLCIISHNAFAILFSSLISIILYILSTFYILRITSELHCLIEETKKIATGDLEHKIPANSLHYPLLSLGNSINEIHDGLSNAINEQLKSEHFKTELITNVSHDIKTPLTSIINYVDLLKKEKLDNETANSYLDVLERKSWRLKNLIEDLVEASKASSGSITLTMYQLNIVELIRQSIGEFEDRFTKRGLEMVLFTEEEPIHILADGRYMYRVIENIFSNIYKYAMQNTRIYVDITIADTHVQISVKNISGAKLNITPDELMERFVRGDSSRNTEGSGLGLSIAQSLVSLQNGTFNIFLDGDLFKTVLEFEIIK